MARITFTYEEVSLQPGWYNSQPDKVEYELPSFLEAVGAPADDWFDLYQEIQTVEGPRGGRAKQTIHFQGIDFSVDRKPVKTRHSSEKGRWEVKITAKP